ncbi:MAG TPA: hypothetical protein VGA37_13400 [Gemmatimonadales bacterium]
MRHKSLLAFGGAAAMLAMAAGPAVAQGLVEVRHPRAVVGIGGTLARPTGEFRRFVGWSGGLDLYGVINVDRGRRIGARIESGVVIYGHEEFQVPLGPSRLDWRSIDGSTNNLIFSLGAGPQLAFGTGSVRPYVYGTAGFSYFATVSSVDVADGANPSTTHFDDFTPALIGGAGVLLQVAGGRHPISVDLSARRIYHGEAEYLRRGGIVERADGSLRLFPVRSQANLFTFHAGLAVGM